MFNPRAFDWSNDGALMGDGLILPAAPPCSDRTPSVRVQERAVIGEPLPPTVELRTVPRYTEYRYARVNDQRVIVDQRNLRVMRIID